MEKPIKIFQYKHSTAYFFSLQYINLLCLCMCAFFSSLKILTHCLCMLFLFLLFSYGFRLAEKRNMCLIRLSQCVSLARSFLWNTMRAWARTHTPVTLIYSRCLRLMWDCVYAYSHRLWNEALYETIVLNLLVYWMEQKKISKTTTSSMCMWVSVFFFDSCYFSFNVWSLASKKKRLFCFFIYVMRVESPVFLTVHRLS